MFSLVGFAPLQVIQLFLPKPLNINIKQQKHRKKHTSKAADILSILHALPFPPPKPGPNPVKNV